MATTLTPEAISQSAKFANLSKKASNNLLTRLMFFKRLPMAFFAGLRVKSFDAQHCAITIPYRWSTQNPFKSIYFAAQAMAAELSTGLPMLTIVQASGHRVSMLVVATEIVYVKKATTLCTFTCNDIPRFFEAVAQTVNTGEGVEVKAKSVGRNTNGDVVSEFIFTWSVKRK